MNVRRVEPPMSIMGHRLPDSRSPQPVRRASPDSEAVASSEDEKPWPSSTRFGHLPVENSVPGLTSGIWQPKRRESFRIAEAARRNAANGARDSRLANGPQAPGSTPSPSTSDTNGALPFHIPLQPTPKLGRSMSHSQGQREYLQNAASSSATTNVQPPALALGLLSEDTESDFDIGVPLTHTVSHPPIGTVLRTPNFSSTYSPVSNGHGNGSTADQANGTRNALVSPNERNAFHRLEQTFSHMGLEQPSRRALWQSSLGWDNLGNVNESRRHSLADIPTRRGSVSGAEQVQEAPANLAHIPGDVPKHDHYDIPAMYRTPHLDFHPYDQSALQQQPLTSPGNPAWGPSAAARPRKLLYMVSFKCARVDVFYLLENTGLTINEGDLVIVEADRGQDLGTVQHAKVTPEEARGLKRRYSEEQYKWLMMYSRNSQGGNNPNAQPGENSGHVAGDVVNTMHAVPRADHSNLKPKAIKRLATEREIRMLTDKEGNEAKAKRTCQQKVAHLHLQMEILDAEWQWDFQKLIFYYYADHYINFKDLITELYRIYKTRIWLGAVNPASFSQHLISQPPSGIGPGAVVPFNPYAGNSTYTMAYGEDKDPYGAQMPYQIPYDTYTPNYPAIPGVANSFAPQPIRGNQHFPTSFTPSRSMDSMSISTAQGPDGGSMSLASPASSNSMFSAQQTTMSPQGYGFPAQDRATVQYDRDRAPGLPRPINGLSTMDSSARIRSPHGVAPTHHTPRSESGGSWNPLPNGQQPLTRSSRLHRQPSLPSPIGTRAPVFPHGSIPPSAQPTPSAHAFMPNHPGVNTNGISLHSGLVGFGPSLGRG